jgi:hypothetical protein
MPRCGCIAVLVLMLVLALAGPAQGASVVFVKKNNVWAAKPDGSRQFRITRDGSRARPYFSPTVADNGTIVALRGVFLHSFRANGRRIVKPRQWAVDPTPALSTEPLDLDLSPNGRLVATDNALYSTYYDPDVSEDRPDLKARFVDFADFRRNKVIGETDSYYDYGSPAWISSKRVITSSYGGYNAQVLEARIGNQTRGTPFYWDPGRDPVTNMNTFQLADPELTRRGDKLAVMRRPVLGADADDPSVATIQIYRVGKPPTRSTPLCTIGPGRRIGQAPDPSWSPDGKTLYWWELGRGLFSTRVTSAPGCGLKPRRLIRAAHSPDLTRATLRRR